MTDATSLRLTTIAALLAAGILAGAQLGKIAPLVEWYRTDAGFSLVLIGWLASTIGVFVALAAFPAGVAIGRFGARASFVAGSGFLVAGGVALALLASPGAILAARAVEGLGYLVLVIAAPAILAAISLPSWKAPVLAIWSCFVPVGFACSDFVARALLPVSEPAIFLLVMTAGYALFAVASALLLTAVADVDTPPPGARPGGMLAASLNPSVILLAAGFGCYVVQSVSFFTFMPSLVADPTMGILLSAGTIALLSPIGNIATSLMVRSERATLWLTVGGMAVTAAAALPAIVAGGLAATVSLAAMVLAGAVAASAIFAALPFVVPRGGSVAVALGLVAQAGGLGTVFGPPLAGYVIEVFGWTGYGWFLALTAATGLALTAPLIAIKPAHAG